MLNSTQAYQLSAALTPSFLAGLPPGSSQANAIAMQNQTAQGGIQAELYKKALKDSKKKSSGLGSILGGAAAVAAAPFTGGASLAFMPAAMQAGGGLESMVTGDVAGGAGQIAGAAANAYGAAGSPGAGGPEISSVAVDPVVSEAVKMAGGIPRPGSQPMRRSGGAPVGGEQYAGDPEGNALPPGQAQAIARFTELSPQQIKSMDTTQRMAMINILGDNGYPLTMEQARALPTKERHDYQKKYGPGIVPMTRWDNLMHRRQAYNEEYAPGRIVPLYPGFEEVL